MNNESLFDDIKCRYFHKPGPQNTGAVLEASYQRAKERSIKKVIVATCGGKTALDALETLDSGTRVIVVTHATGLREPNYQELSEKARKEIESKAGTVLTCQHAFSGVGRGIKNKLATSQADEIIACTLRTFGQGTKVAIEIALMAADAGLVRTDEEVISIGGTGKGADTALVLQPANSFNFFDLKVKEVICKPTLTAS